MDGRSRDRAAAAVRIEPGPPGATHPLRQRVLRPHQSVGEVAFPGDDHPDALHLVARTPGDVVVGVASVMPEAPPWEPPVSSGPAADQRAWRLRGMATAERWRSGGVGTDLVLAIVDHVAAHGGGLLWCNARVPARRFYERHGFTARGEVWDEPDIGPHLAMWRLVPPGGPG